MVLHLNRPQAAIKQIVICLIIAFSAGWILLFDIDAVDAHTPHDDIYSVAVSPDYRNDKTLFVLTRGAVLKSTDAGNSWYSVVNGLDNRYIPFFLDISASEKKVMYLSTLGDGLYKSEDGGESWILIPKGPPSKELDLVAISSYSSDTLFARDINGRLFRSMDGSLSWTEVTPERARVSAFGFTAGVRDEIMIGDTDGSVRVSEDAGSHWRTVWPSGNNLAVTALAARRVGNASRQIFVGTADGKVLRSFDGGSSFATVFEAGTDQPVTSVSFSPGVSDNARIFAVLWDDGVMCSKDSGNTWHQCSKGLTQHNQSTKLGRPSYGRLLTSPAYSQDKTLFLAGFDGLFRSTNAGKRWTQVETLSTSLLLGLGISPIYHHDHTLGITSYLWGAYLSEDGGVSWHSINSGAEDYVRDEGLTRLFNIVFSPGFESDNTLFSSTWYRILKSNNMGRQWRQIIPVESKLWRGTHHGMVIALSSNYSKDGVIYVGTHRGHLLRSQDGGERYDLLHEFGTEISALVLSPNFVTDKEVFVGLSGEIHKSADGGKTWSRMGSNLCPAISAGTTIKRLADDLPGRMSRETKKWGIQVETEDRRACGVRLVISPAYSTDQTIFAGSAGGLFKSVDGGGTWSRVDDAAFGSNVYIEGMALSPGFVDDQTVLVSLRGKGLYKSVDGGQTFQAVGRNLIASNHNIANPPCFPIPNSTPLVFSPAYGQDKTIFGYSGSSLFKSTDTGKTWQHVFSQSPSLGDRLYVLYRYYKQRLARKAKSLIRDQTFLIGGIFLAFAGCAVFLIHRKIMKKGVGIK